MSTNLLCNICNKNLITQKCEECQIKYCSNKECQDPHSINIKGWTCCFNCYLKKKEQEIIYQIENGLITQCIHCGYADLYTKCSCEVSDEDILNYYMSNLEIKK